MDTFLKGCEFITSTYCQNTFHFVRSKLCQTKYSPPPPPRPPPPASVWVRHANNINISRDEEQLQRGRTKKSGGYRTCSVLLQHMLHNTVSVLTETRPDGYPSCDLSLLWGGRVCLNVHSSFLLLCDRR